MISAIPCALRGSSSTSKKLHKPALEKLNRQFCIQKKNEFLRKILFPEFYRLQRLEIDAATLQDVELDKEKGILRFSASDEDDAITLSAELQETAPASSRRESGREKSQQRRGSRSPR